MDHASLEDRLRRDLHERGDQLPVRGTGPAAVRRTATRRRRRHQLTGVTVTVTLVGAATASVIVTRDRGEPSLVSAGSAAVTDLAAVTAPPFDWTVLDEHSEVGDAPAVVTGADGTLYALSTAPGAPAPPDDKGNWVPPAQTLYASTDGTTWTPRTLDDLWIGSLAEHDGVLYAVGTAPATAAVGGTAAVAARSTDGGATWTKTPLPLALGDTGPSGLKTHLGSVSLATGPAGVVAVASTWSDLDVASRLPAGTDVRWGWETKPDGVDVDGPVTDLAAVAAEACPAGWTASIVAADPAADAKRAGLSIPAPAVAERNGRGGDVVSCQSPDTGVAPLVVPQPVEVVQHLTWSQLGVDPAAGAQVGRSTTHVFTAADGQALGEVSVPFADGVDVRVIGTADGYVVLAQAYPDTGATVLTVWRSSDGRSWAPIATPALADVSSVAGAGVLDGALVVVDGGGRILRSTDGVTWTATDLAGALGEALPAGARVQVNTAGVGPAGIVLSADVAQPSVLHPVTHDGVTLRIADTTATILDATTGEVLADGVAIDRASVSGVVRVDPNAGGIIVYDAAGAVRARFGYDEIKGALSESVWDPRSAVVLTSTDGIHVGATPLTDLIGGASGFISWIEVTDRALVNVARTGDGTDPGDRVLLVGTPPR